MTYAAPRAALAILLIGLALATPSLAANLDQLMQDFRVTPTGSRPAPAFTLTTLGGQPATLAAQGGRPVLLYFWATW